MNCKHCNKKIKRYRNSKGHLFWIHENDYLLCREKYTFNAIAEPEK